jgi:gamma-glutamyltranspeptidase/glutathione hydrolase
MLALLDGTDLSDPVERLSAIVEAQRAAVGYRRDRYHDPTQIAAAFEEALHVLGSRVRGPESTTHTSAADADGYACSLTESNGYGSGLVARGILLNNTLGEEELNPLGAHRLPPGSRTQSNMAPTIASRGEDLAVAIGSPGADRIVGAITQTFLRIAVDGASLADAVAGPRAHLDPRLEGETLCYEPGLPGDQLSFVQRPYDDIHMYFGAVQAAIVSSDGTVDAVHDPRRSGGSALV